MLDERDAAERMLSSRCEANVSCCVSIEWKSLFNIYFIFCRIKIGARIVDLVRSTHSLLIETTEALNLNGSIGETVNWWEICAGALSVCNTIDNSRSKWACLHWTKRFSVSPFLVLLNQSVAAYWYQCTDRNHVQYNRLEKREHSLVCVRCGEYAYLAWIYFDSIQLNFRVLCVQIYWHNKEAEQLVTGCLWIHRFVRISARIVHSFRDRSERDDQFVNTRASIRCIKKRETISDFSSDRTIERGRKRTRWNMFAVRRCLLADFDWIALWRMCACRIGLNDSTRHAQIDIEH